MGNSSSSSSSGVGFVGLLTIVFIILKLIGQIDWSWWWVLSPIWISGMLIMSIVAILFFIERKIKSSRFKRRRK